MVNVVARMEIKPGCMEKFLKILLGNVPTVLKEDGCHRYEPCFDADPATTQFVTILETWESEAHLKAHLATPHMVNFKNSVTDLRFSSVITVLKPIEA